jgi:SNF2 family DNA or RNA helicase
MQSPQRLASAQLERELTAEQQADEEERAYREFMASEAAKAKREEEIAEIDARKENEAKTAEAAYSAALSVIDKTIERAQTYSQRMLGMQGSNLSDEEMLVKEQPKNLRGTLRDYQLEGFRWIVRRAFAGESIILADEMGLGALVGEQCSSAPECCRFLLCF